MVERRGLGAAKRIFAIGWAINIANLLAILIAGWLPVYIRIRPDREFFFLDEQVPFLRNWLVFLIAYTVLALVFVFIASRLMYSSVQDGADSAAAEASMKLSRVLSVVAAVLCFISFVIIMRTYQTWDAYLQSRLN
ncbi:MAG: hypothetical protein U0R49_12295 [Fimbriimonadales bacterium]